MNSKLILEQADFNEIKSTLKKVLNVINTLSKSSPLTEQWLDNQDISNLLHVSKRTLQNYRDNGIIPFSQIGGKIYYKASDVEKLLLKHYVNVKNY
ncbi:MAG: helix-turn-helix domain-containing protein [Bacteroidota bacterium]